MMSDPANSFLKLCTHEIDISIIMSLHVFNSLNLKTMVSLSGESKTTVLRHVKELLQSNVIVIDSEVTGRKRGIFYMLHQNTRKIIDEASEIKGEKKDIFHNSELISQLLNAFKATALMNQGLSRIAQSFFQEYVQKIEQSSESKMFLNFTIMSLMFESNEEVEEFKKIINDFYEKIKKYDRKFDKMSPLFHMMFLFTYPIGRFDQMLLE